MRRKLIGNASTLQRMHQVMRTHFAALPLPAHHLPFDIRELVDKFGTVRTNLSGNTRESTGNYLLDSKEERA